MKKPQVSILDIPFINVLFDEMVSIITERIKEEKKTFIVTANPEIVMHTFEDKEYKEFVQSADYVVPDGNGIILASKILNNPIKERIAGYDLMMSLLSLANTNGWKVYLLGGKEETNHKAATTIQQKFPNAQLVGSHHGFFDWDNGEIQKEVSELEPDLVFVALGVPRQEKWIGENIPYFTKGIFIGVGGSIDVLAGEVKRAPEIWIKLKLEWLYRLFKQPSRWRRMLALPYFVIKVLKIKLGK